MWARRTMTVAWAGAAMLVVTAMAANPAAAHGAPEDPISRTLACAPDGPYVGSEVCQAALAASDRQAFEDWDYVRVAGVAGRDREEIPDGALCSGGVPGFAGLDLARADWPTTELRAGAEFTFSYVTTIPHQGEFRLYLTKDGYDPAEPLAWSDLEDEPFLTVADPELANDAYRLPGRLPDGKTGRHMVFTIWQNTDTPDTYYACSDVVFESPASPPASSPASPVAEPVTLETPARPVDRNLAVPLAAAAGLAGLGVAAVLVFRRQRRLPGHR